MLCCDRPDCVVLVSYFFLLLKNIIIDCNTTPFLSDIQKNILQQTSRVRERRDSVLLSFSRVSIIAPAGFLRATQLSDVDLQINRQHWLMVISDKTGGGGIALTTS